ncbi:MAG: phosphoenolpyruvate--protein phosphotransferase [Spongiibacteraceae bacterium]
MVKNVILELTRIVQQVALVESAAAQVRLIVDSISQVIGVDVCTLYRTEENKDMTLLASHGLAVHDQIKIPAGKGLVSLVVQRRHPINIVNPAQHPNYYYIESTQEEAFCTFCGVPLVRFGEVIGVLVVQSTQANLLSAENEGFLVTLASQLALIVANITTIDTRKTAINQRIIGIKGAPGIGIGIAQLRGNGGLNNVSDAPCIDKKAEIQQWHDILLATRNEIKNEQASLGEDISGSVSGIFDAYNMLLSDHALIQKVESEILSGHWLPSALRTSVNYFSDLFLSMEDPYLKARHEDIKHLGNKLFNVWRGTNLKNKPQIKIDGQVILVGSQISISDIAAIPLEQLSGIICFEGSSLSHTAVLANAMGIPAVMGAEDAKYIQNEELLIVDGNEGQIINHPGKNVLKEFKQLITKRQRLDDQLAELYAQPATSTDGESVRLLTNTGLLADISPGLKNGAEGIGLYRTEIPFMVRNSFPTEDDQVFVYQKIFSAYQGKPVYMRTLDIGGDKQLPYFPISNEENPALGWRGIRFTLDNIQLLMTQVRAMIRAAETSGDLHILLPMISSSNELDAFILLLDDACEQLESEGINFKRPKIGVMIEVPAAISLLPFWAKKIDFISIGSNDLSQYLLALDRNNTRVAARYDQIHPAVLHEIYRVVKLAKKFKLPLSLCGEMASDPVAVFLLLGMGIRTLSMSATKLPRIKWLIRSIDISHAQQVLAQALTFEHAGQIRSLVQKEIISAGLSELIN